MRVAALVANSVLEASPRWWDAWLEPTSHPDELIKMLRPADDDLLEVFPVTRDLLRIKAPDASVSVAV
jgi:putative SOS response-associated peptidase YedK